MMGRRWEQLNAHPRSRDGLVAATHLLLGLALLQAGAIKLWSDVAVFDTSGLAFLLALLGMVAISTQRSTRPFTALALGTPVAMIDVLHGGSLGVALVYFDLVYCAVKYGSDRGVRIAIWIAAGLAALTCAGLLLRPWGSEAGAVPLLAVQWVLIVAVAGMWGWNVRTERLRTRALLAEQHARATQHMRQRIAHDLHDLVSNQIAVAGLHVEAARLRIEQAPITATEALGSLDRATEGTEEAHRQLRRLIAVLTTVDDIGEVGASDPAAEFEALEALPPGDRAVVWRDEARHALATALSDRSPEQRAVILRVLRELVANAVKHGYGDIVVESEEPPADPEHLSVSVRNAYDSRAVDAPDRGIGITGAALLLEGTGARVASRPEAPGERWRAILTVPRPAGAADQRRGARPVSGGAS